MPYITKDRRDLIDAGQPPSNVGELNYAVTRLCHNYLKGGPLNYASINAVMGVLESAKHELYAMVARPYEDKKRAENGAISHLDAEVRVE